MGRKASVADCVGQGEGLFWHIGLGMSLHDWELDQLLGLMALLYEQRGTEEHFKKVFLGGLFVRVIWTLIYTLFGMVWVLHEELVVVKVGVAAGLEDRKKFSGFTKDYNIVEEAEKLSIGLRRSPWATSTSSKSEYAYSIAQYNSPFKIFGRVNEVWVELDESALDSCKSNAVASY
ncbi:hypothetical protein Acr_23g0004030 [Actinidia rufa]|uniref:Uncharacterized protein n=1 Tax=Actinidia rufa TaxID=165716 RepID=A0A7J0GMR2_9ERIC|nr:hypothetical protein Acr_23g0004030 [Actinidia rufa]